MNLTSKLAAAALCLTSLVPLSASAWEPAPYVPQARVYGAHGGRYEWRTVNRWVPGRREQSWVPQRCWVGAWGRTRCRGGFYAPRWVPGYYAPVQTRLYVPFFAPVAMNYGY